jgi:hypothetical protein
MTMQLSFTAGAAMNWRKGAIAATCVACALACTTAQAIDLIAIGVLPGDGVDHSGQSALLKNGVRADLLGGIGSGLAWAGGSTFLALPDRGPNAVAWNATVDNTTSYIPRFLTLHLHLKQQPDAATGLPFTLLPVLAQTTLLYSRERLHYGGVVAGYGATPASNTPERFYFSGRSDNFDAGTGSSDPLDARLDTEGIRLSRDGRSVFISDEYGPYLYEFDRHTGARLRVFTLPAILAVSHKSPMGANEISGKYHGSRCKQGNGRPGNLAGRQDAVRLHAEPADPGWRRWGPRQPHRRG